jgi:hypothetical protein
MTTETAKSAIERKMVMRAMDLAAAGDTSALSYNGELFEALIEYMKGVRVYTGKHFLPMLGDVARNMVWSAAIRYINTEVEYLETAFRTTYDTASSLARNTRVNSKGKVEEMDTAPIRLEQKLDVTLEELRYWNYIHRKVTKPGEQVTPQEILAYLKGSGGLQTFEPITEMGLLRMQVAATGESLEEAQQARIQELEGSRKISPETIKSNEEWLLERLSLYFEQLTDSIKFVESEEYMQAMERLYIICAEKKPRALRTKMRRAGSPSKMKALADSYTAYKVMGETINESIAQAMEKADTPEDRRDELTGHMSLAAH